MCTICTQVQKCTRGANLHPGCIFGHVNGVLRICTRVQICSCLRGGSNWHPGANCAHERKLYNSIHFDNGRHFLLRCCLKSIKNKFQVVINRKEYHVYYFHHSSIRYWNLYGYDRSPPPTHTFLESKHQAR